MTYADGICHPENADDLLMIEAVLKTLPCEIGSVQYRVTDHIRGPWFGFYGNPLEPSLMQLVNPEIEGRCALWVGDGPTREARIFYELPNTRRPGTIETGRLGRDIPTYNYTHPIEGDINGR
jgi:hypothetical protein